MNRPTRRIPGYDVDRVDVAAGLRELRECGHDDPKTTMVVEYALARWARGERRRRSAVRSTPPSTGST